MKTIYLSEIHFAQVHNAYALHQILKSAAPDERRILFRSDIFRIEGRRPQSKLLVQTCEKPVWSALPDDALASPPRVRPVAWELTKGRSFRFRLRANVTRQRKGLSEPSTRDLEGPAFRSIRGKRVAIWNEEDQRSWLARKASAAGFEIVTVPIPTAEGTMTSQSLLLGKHVDGSQELALSSRVEIAEQRKTEHRLRFDGVNFEGYLKVTDPISLEEALMNGIGSAKAFGFGLLSLARV